MSDELAGLTCLKSIYKITKESLGELKKSVLDMMSLWA